MAEKDIIAEDGSVFSLLAVSDGHGSARHFRSGKGAEIAISACREILVRNMKWINERSINNDECDRIGKFLAKEITDRWRLLVDEDIAENPVREDELEYLRQSGDYEAEEAYRKGTELHIIYGCTLLAAFWTDKLFMAIQIGDGDIIISYDGKKFISPVPEDEDCIFNITTSLCDSREESGTKDAEEEFRWYWDAANIPSSILITSDGVINSFAGKKNMYKSFHNPICSLYSELDRFEECNGFCKDYGSCLDCYESFCKRQIDEHLPWLTEKGSGDDISLAMCLNLDDENLRRNVMSAVIFEKTIGGFNKEARNIRDSMMKKDKPFIDYNLGLFYIQMAKDNVCDRKKTDYYLTAAYRHMHSAKRSGVKEAGELLEEVKRLNKELSKK